MENEERSNLPPFAQLNDLQSGLKRLPENLRSKYLLVLAVSERAKQLVLDPEQRRTQSDENQVSVALQEMAERRLQLQITDERLLHILQGQPEDTDIFPYRP